MVLGRPTISSYYRAAIEKLREEVEEAPESYVLNVDPQAWADYLEKKYGMEPIRFDETRQEELQEIDEKKPTLTFILPVIPSDTIDAIMHYHLIGERATLGRYVATDITYDSEQATLSIECAATSQGVDSARQFIREQIGFWNESIEKNNQGFAAQVKSIVEKRRQLVLQKNRNLDLLAQKVGIPLRKKIDSREVIPTALPTKRRIRPVMPQARREKQLVLERKIFDAILELIDNQCRQFERTRTVFAAHGEEDLRDIILSSLNAVFEGDAVGEAFHGLGRVDIHLRISKGELFIAECKYWDGPSSVAKATEQVLERLTWHESYGVVIVFSRNANFGRVRNSLAETIPSLPHYSGGLRSISEHHSVCNSQLPSDTSKRVEVHYLVYNLYTPESSS